MQCGRLWFSSSQRQNLLRTLLFDLLGFQRTTCWSNKRLLESLSACRILASMAICTCLQNQMAVRASLHSSKWKTIRVATRLTGQYHRAAWYRWVMGRNMDWIGLLLLAV
jgi:hypothetical protein